MKTFILLFTLFAFSICYSQEWPDRSQKRSFLSIVVDSVNHEYWFNDFSCIEPLAGYETWTDDLVSSLRKDANINTDSLKASFKFSVSDEGILKLNSILSKNENDSLIAKKISQAGTWKSKNKNCKNLEITVGSKKLEVFTIVDEAASFPGGLQAFFDYLGENLKYPEEAQKKGIEGRVFIQFIVEKDGSITNAAVVKGIGAGCDEEALRVIKDMPKWIPGKQQGTPIRQKMLQNILFKFRDSPEKKKKRRKRG